VINLSGSFLRARDRAGVVDRSRADRWYATLGSYTTFSTWMFETDRLAETGAVAATAVNLIASIVLGVALAALGGRSGGGSETQAPGLFSGV